MGYVVVDYGYILKTINAGVTWTSLSSGTTDYLYSVFFENSNTGYVVGSRGTILKTNNSGTTWSVLEFWSITMNDLKSVCFTDANTGYVVGEDGAILKTTNGGVGIKQLQRSETNNLIFYPNPVKTTLTLINVNLNAIISIYDLQGNILLYNTNLDNQIKVNNLPGGMYIIKINDKNTIKTVKFIKA
jgi:hypothetical protein